MRPLLLNNSEPGRPAPGVRLAISVALLVAIWLVLLPAIAQVSTIRTMIDRHEAHGVDPSAKFYSELPAMPMISQQVDEIRRAGPAAFGLSEGPERHPERSEGSGSSNGTPDPSLRSG